MAARRSGGKGAALCAAALLFVVLDGGCGDDGVSCSNTAELELWISGLMSMGLEFMEGAGGGVARSACSTEGT